MREVANVGEAVKSSLDMCQWMIETAFLVGAYLEPLNSIGDSFRSCRKLEYVSCKELEAAATLPSVSQIAMRLSSRTVSPEREVRRGVSWHRERYKAIAVERTE